VTRERLVAVHASVTVRLGFDGVLVPGERWAGQEPFDPAEGLRPDRMRVNGSLALGLVRRCTRLLGPGPLDDELADCRELLDDAITADATAMAEARAAASELAVRAAAALAVRDGSRSVTVDQHAQRLAREALFLLVFGSRPGIKSALLRRLGASGAVLPLLHAELARGQAAAAPQLARGIAKKPGGTTPAPESESWAAEAPL
jgi:hypothetical protein